MTDKKASLFDSISNSYDKFNHTLSLGIDRMWRKKSLRHIVGLKNAKVLDVACGTGDLSIELIKQGAAHVTGTDISEGMIAIGRKKIESKHFSQQIEMTIEDCSAMSFADNSFDCITCAFGVRNFTKRKEGLKEMYRVLKTGGQLMILEFAMPQMPIIKQLYNFYFKHILPHIGKLMSGDKAPYEYFYNSVKQFPQRQLFMQELSDAGFTPKHFKVMTLGIAIAYYAEK